MPSFIYTIQIYEEWKQWIWTAVEMWQDKNVMEPKPLSSLRQFACTCLYSDVRVNERTSLQGSSLMKFLVKWQWACWLNLDVYVPHSCITLFRCFVTWSLMWFAGKTNQPSCQISMKWMFPHRKKACKLCSWGVSVAPLCCSSFWGVCIEKWMSCWLIFLWELLSLMKPLMLNSLSNIKHQISL